jgi:hypothetical protein
MYMPCSLANCASRIFNNLIVFNKAPQFDSPRLHHFRQGNGVPSLRLAGVSAFSLGEPRGTRLLSAYVRESWVRRVESHLT